MNKERLARLITFGVLAAALGFVFWRKPDAEVAPVASTTAAMAEPSVQDAVYAMFDAAKEGKVEVYLDAYGGALRASLDQSLKEQGTEKFAAYLRSQTAVVKGLAVNEPQRPTETQARVQVEYVYQDRNETQWLTLDRTAGGWKISRIEAAERIKTLVPYGTPVN